MTTTVPAAKDHGHDHDQLTETVRALSARVLELEAKLKQPDHVVRPEDFGAVAGRDCTDAFIRMMKHIDTGLRPDAGGGVPVARHTVLLGPGPYLISRPWMVPRAGRAQGLTIRGIAKRATEIVWSGEGPMLTNQDRWMGVRWEHVSFRGTNPKGAYLYSSSTGACQDWAWSSCEWRGSWAYGIGLDGPAASNTNSEMRFDGCHINGSYATAFLWSGMTPAHSQQDQFLNFWFTNCKVEYDWGDFIRFDRGGFIRLDGGSYIIKGRRPDGQMSRFIHLPVAGHADSVQHLSVRDVRFELRNALSQVIFSRWNAGHITFDQCSDTAQGFRSHSPGLVAHEYDVAAGAPQIRYVQCDLVGTHRVRSGAASTARGRIVYDQCTRKNHRTLDAFLRIAAGGALPRPSEFSVSHRDDGDGLTS
ncbi:hypothetical protein [Streptomyces purpureus]|uniref:Uncharacterized protein n=1 Tax=Streptomyces purpureus TaxID=1951 RepID=A0A918LW36_9ACTN|nr:hypothetical protein [Streptomyces purpureus]GGT58376.1 hypothetical protein GCM10014713_60040 [Streptomyces purpureus]